MNSYFMSLESPVGRLVLTSNDTHLKSLTFSDEQVDVSENLPGILQKAAVQLAEYFAGTRFQFDLDLDPDGTGFQKRVWQQLLQVPYGTTKSYRDIAVELGSNVEYTRRWHCEWEKSGCDCRALSQDYRK